MRRLRLLILFLSLSKDESAESGNADELFAEVAAVEEAEEGFRHVLDALHHVLAEFKPAFAVPRRELRQAFGEAVGEVGDEEAFQPREIDGDLAVVADADVRLVERSEERRVGKGGVRTGGSGWGAVK